MEEIFPPDKKKFLEEHYPFTPVPDMDQMYRCLHCVEVIRVGDYKVFKGRDGFLFICCPNAPACNGSVIDWMPIESG